MLFTVLVAGLAPCLLRPPGVRPPPLHAPAARCSVGCSAATRPPYFISGLERPRYRGAAVRVLHSSRAWYVISAVYVVVAWRMPSPAPLQRGGLALRVLAAAISSANIWISDGYHNADRRGGAALSRAAELTWLRWDYICVSGILSYQLWLWAANFGWAWDSVLTVASGGCTALVCAFSRLASHDPAHYGHLGVKLTMAVHFVVLMGYLLLTAPPVGRGRLGFGVATYGLGLVLWTLRRPRSDVFGYHEWFHVTVVAGHLASMVCDLANVARPCAKLAGLPVC